MHEISSDFHFGTISQGLVDESAYMQSTLFNIVLCALFPKCPIIVFGNTKTAFYIPLLIKLQCDTISFIFCANYELTSLADPILQGDSTGTPVNHTIVEIHIVPSTLAFLPIRGFHTYHAGF